MKEVELINSTDYQKAYDKVLCSWVIESLNMMGIAKKCCKVFGENKNVLEGGANLWY